MTLIDDPQSLKDLLGDVEKILLIFFGDDKTTTAVDDKATAMKANNALEDKYVPVRLAAASLFLGTQQNDWKLTSAGRWARLGADANAAREVEGTGDVSMMLGLDGTPSS